MSDSTDSNKVRSFKDYEGQDDLKASMPAFHNPADRRAPPHVAPQTQQQDSEPKGFIVTESMVMDYFTLSGIENKLGIKKEEIPTYILNEILANSLDYVETISKSLEFTPEVDVEITSNDKVINLKVSNSCEGQSFTDQIITSIFNFSTYSSSKRKQFKITRGVLGHGLKTVLSTSHTLATEHYGYTNWTPLKIRNGNKQWTIALTIVDRINGEIHTPDIKSTSINDILKTEIEIDIPVDSDSADKITHELGQTFCKYPFLNPHITMNLTTNGKHYGFPQVQKIKSDWKNLHSIHSYSYKDFENLLFNIKGENLTLYDIPHAIGLREAPFLKKQAEFNIPLVEAQHDKSIIHTLYDNLQNIKDPKEKLDLPYDMRIKSRKDAIIKRFEQLGIRVKKIKYELVNGRSEDGDVKFPYVFEIAEIKTVDSKHRIISGINSTPTKLVYIHNPGGFEYVKSKYTYGSHSISEILKQECGYSNDPKKCKKADSIVFMNLISPRIDYESYVKSQVNLSPFGKVIGQAVYDTCKGGMRPGRSKGQVSQTELLINILRERWKAVQQNPGLIIDDRWTPSDVWYLIRPQLLENGIIITQNTRSNLTAKIRPKCEELFGVNMEELGIFAADRAQMYFDGHWYDVGFDELDSLVVKGTDLIIIEKEGMAEVLTSLSDKLGLALLFTRGFATKYVCDLSELSKQDGCNVMVLSDYDASGILLASKLKVPRIGIDPDTLEYFELEREDVEEEYDPGNHRAGIKGLVSEEEYEYLSENRIEINSIKTKVGSKAFQEWVIYKLNELFRNRDYNRAIEIGEAVLPDNLKEHFDYITAKIQSYQKNTCDKLVEYLSNTKGFREVPKHRIDIDENLKKVVTDIPNYKDFANKLNELVESHPFFREDSTP